MPANTSSPPKRRFRLTIAYDGTAYAGWQVQPGNLTVQEVLEARMEAVVGHPCKVHGSGRTDQGVHAVGQVAHVDIETRMPPKSLRLALNARLPGDIRIVGARVVNPRFHARRSAVAKEYRYFIWNDDLMSPHQRLYALHVRRPLDLTAMQAAAAQFVGEHDFVAFMANPNRAVESTVRTVMECQFRRRGKRIRHVLRRPRCQRVRPPLRIRRDGRADPRWTAPGPPLPDHSVREPAPPRPGDAARQLPARRTCAGLQGTHPGS